MFKICCFSLICIFFGAFSFSPQTIHEIRSILSDDKLLKVSDRIEEIKRTERGYFIITQNHITPVTIKYHLQSYSAHTASNSEHEFREFEITFHEPVNISNFGL